MKNIFKYGMFIAFMAVIAVNFISCDDHSGGLPEIEYVRITRPSAADSLLTGAHTGTTIAIIGRNLQDAQKVYINDQPVSFNPNMNTNHSIIVTIPSEENGFILTDFDSNLKPEIRVETTNGTATYRFDIYYPSPEIKEVLAEVYPAQTGGRINVSGLNFVNLQRVYFTNVNPNPLAGEEVAANPVEITVPASAWENHIENHRYLDKMTKKYITESTLWFDLPELPRVDDIFSGYLVIEGQDALASIKFSTLPPPSILSVSTDMPIPGATMVITGKDFIQVESVNINNGEIVILPEDMTVTPNTISFVMPAKPSKKGTLTITALGGAVTMDNFYPVDHLITTMEVLNTNFWTWDASTLKDCPEVNSDGVCGVLSGKLGSPTWWWKQVTIYHFTPNPPLPDYDVIPANTPVSKLQLVYECYIGAFSNVQLSLRFPAMNDRDEVRLPELTNMSGTSMIFDNWHAMVVPFSTFPSIAAATYEDFVNSWVADGGMMFHILNPNTTGDPGDVLIYFDNIRIKVVE